MSLDGLVLSCSTTTMMSSRSRRPRSPSRSHLTATLFALTILLPSVEAYTWTFTSTPKQCGNLTISVSGSDGRPPYRVLILPFGPTPLAGNIEARRIMDMPFPNGGGSVGFQLKYPANSQFVAVVSMSFHCGSTCLSFRYFLASLSFVVSFQTWINPMPMPTYGHLSPPFLKHRRVVLLWPFIDITTQSATRRSFTTSHRYHPPRSHPPLLEPMLHPVCHSPVALTTLQSTSIKTILPPRLSIAPQKP